MKTHQEAFKGKWVQEHKMKKVIFFLLFTVLLISCRDAIDQIIEDMILKQINRQDVEMLDDGKLHVILIGSGGPINNDVRTAPCTAIVAGGEFILIDVGPSSWRGVDLANMPLGHLSGVFLTHFHSDHIGDLGEANLWSWVNGRTQRLEVFGPEGVETVVAGVTQTYALDTEYRIAHHGEDVLPPEAGKMLSSTIAFGNADEATLFFDRNGLKAYAFLVDHAPATPAVGYRIEYGGNAVVITGDTKKTENLERHAQAADILISNGLSFRLMDMTSKVLRENAQERLAKMTADTMTYQMDPIHAAEVAQAAGARKLLFNHITPPLPNAFADMIFLEGVMHVYSGEVIMGEDGMRFDLSPIN
jgi:ribonuclease Z